MTLRRTTATGLAALACLLAASALAQTAPKPNDPSLVANLALYCSMDNTTSWLPVAYWQDASGNGYDAKQNAVPYWGQLDTGGANRETAVTFDSGSLQPSDPRELTVLNGLNAAIDPGTQDFSVSLWYNQSFAGQQGQFQYLLDKGNDASSSNPGFAFYTNLGVPGIRMNDVGASASGDTRQYLGANSATAPNQNDISGAGWHHLVGIFDRSGAYNAPNTVSLYVDGVLFDSKVLPTVAGNPYNITAVDKELYLAGRASSATTNNLEGYLDDVAIYRGALSAADVSTLYNLPYTTPLSASTISGVTPVAIHNFATNLNRPAEVPGIVPDDHLGTYPGQIFTPSVMQVTDAQRGEVMGFEGGARIGSYGRGVHYGDVLDPGTSSYTVSVWFKTDDVTTMQRIANKGEHGSSSNGWIITVNNGELWVRGCYDATADNRLGLTKSGVTAGQWHHVALVLDQDLGIIRGYLDGQGSGDLGTANGWSVLDGYNLAFPTGTDFQGDWNTSIGAEEYVYASYPLVGRLDDFAIWNRKLSDADIFALAGSPPVVQIPGDTNNDKKVDSTDAQALATNWGASGDEIGRAQGDFNGDHAVNAADASILAANWGDHTGESAGVPEPGAIVLALSAAIGLWCVRPRRTPA